MKENGKEEVLLPTYFSIRALRIKTWNQCRVHITISKRDVVPFVKEGELVRG